MQTTSVMHRVAVLAAVAALVAQTGCKTRTCVSTKNVERERERERCVFKTIHMGIETIGMLARLDWVALQCTALYCTALALNQGMSNALRGSLQIARRMAAASKLPSQMSQ